MSSARPRIYVEERKRRERAFKRPIRAALATLVCARRYIVLRARAVIILLAERASLGIRARFF